jgi:hypothetical protein
MFILLSDDSLLLAICDITVEGFEALCGSKTRESEDDTDSEWEEADH